MEKSGCSYERLFNHFDINGDGKISPSDLTSCIKAVSPQELSNVEAAVASFCSGDGLLGLEDFEMFVAAGERMKELEEAFMMYTEEGLGIITPASLRNMLTNLGELRSLDDCKKMIQKFDLNGDGVLNFDEFRLMIIV